MARGDINVKFDGSRLTDHGGRSCEAVADRDTQGVSFQCVVTLALDNGLITAQALPTFTPKGRRTSRRQSAAVPAPTDTPEEPSPSTR